MVDGGGENSLAGAESPPIAHPTPVSESGLNSVRVVVYDYACGCPDISGGPYCQVGRLEEAPPLA